jgi:formamidopyrimidine-DNA glycosylase
MHGWRMLEPFAAPAADATIGKLLPISSAFVHRTFPAAALDLHQLGLDPPLISLHLDDLELRFGATEPVDERRYVQIGDMVHLIDDRYLPQLLASAEHYVDRRLLPAGFSPMLGTIDGRPLGAGAVAGVGGRRGAAGGTADRPLGGRVLTLESADGGKALRFLIDEGGTRWSRLDQRLSYLFSQPPLAEADEDSAQGLPEPFAPMDAARPARTAQPDESADIRTGIGCRIAATAPSVGNRRHRTPAAAGQRTNAHREAETMTNTQSNRNPPTPQMPELPEVETSLRGIEPHLRGRRILRSGRARASPALAGAALGGRGGGRATDHRTAPSCQVSAAGIGTGRADAASGHVRQPARAAGGHATRPARPHRSGADDGQCLRLRDPRRFGSLHWVPPPTQDHPLLRDWAPSPYPTPFTAPICTGLPAVGVAPSRVSSWTAISSSGSATSMPASHCSWPASIRTDRPGALARNAMTRLAESIKQVLAAAIAEGGTSLRDFVQEDGNPGYFAQQLARLRPHRGTLPRLRQPVRQQRIGQRSSFYCPRCQR